MRYQEQEKETRPLILFLTGIAFGWLTSRMLDRDTFNTRSVIQEMADQRIQQNINLLIARKVGRSEKEVSAVMEDWHSDPELSHEIQKNMRDCTLRFDQLPNNKVRLTVHITWGEDDQMMVTQNWQWSELPYDVRKALMRNGNTVYVTWALPI